MTNQRSYRLKLIISVSTLVTRSITFDLRTLGESPIKPDYLKLIILFLTTHINWSITVICDTVILLQSAEKSVSMKLIIKRISCNMLKLSSRHFWSIHFRLICLNCWPTSNLNNYTPILNRARRCGNCFSSRYFQTDVSGFYTFGIRCSKFTNVKHKLRPRNFDGVTND